MTYRWIVLTIAATLGAIASPARAPGRQALAQRRAYRHRLAGAGAWARSASGGTLTFAPAGG